MSFTDDLQKFALKVENRSRAVFLGSVDAVKQSIVEGSAVTAAPGQPVDTGNLVSSWQETFPEDLIGDVTTNVEYAPAIEEGQQAPYTNPHGTQVTPGPMTLRSAVGGFHSVKLTRAGWKPLVASVVKDVVQ